MNYRVWYSTESFADYIIDNTVLSTKSVTKKKMYESDANNAKNFHTMPDHIKKILYLDAPDIIVELDSEPIFSIEVSTEAGTGHNVFQRFARLAASVENNVPAFYIYPEAVIIHRQGNPTRWDAINALVFKALEDVMNIYSIPALFYYFPSDFKTYSNPNSSPNIQSKGLKYDRNISYAGSPDSGDSEMRLMFDAINEVISVFETAGIVQGRSNLLSRRVVIDRRSFMQQEYFSKNGNLQMSPLTSTIKIPTIYLLNYLSQYENSNYKIGELLRSRDETIIYFTDSKFRGDPFPGALAAIDYLCTRQGKTFEERKYNLVMVWGNLVKDETNKTLQLTSARSSINNFTSAVQTSEAKNILKKSYNQLAPEQVPRYYMQVRYGSTYSKAKHIRVYSYFADAILFSDGALWRDA
ncbi:hypothetical protein [Emticicia sp. 21SJ11W-3]|uniref:hypothetical protein n=1 Tax=Emticicia sp. 21SJ11W-3 TaxID=2916755 RepID=UPI00209F8C7C|nr:hypothetical protein [Emticicia sp. 21SJ11W-3]UTA67712.1 hypothetical protein MB380_19250 [Emticicia sp. 21SJ11W-3]